MLVWDPTHEFHPFGFIQTFVYKGRLYGQYPPWFCYLSAPFYLMWGRTGLRIVPLVGGVVLLWASYALARRLAIRHAPLAACTVVFATPLLPYCYTFWDIVPALAGAMVGLCAAVDACKTAAWLRILLAVFALWFAFVMHEEYLLWFVCVLGVLAVMYRNWRVTAVLSLLSCVGVISVMLLNRLLIGLPLFYHASTGSGVLPEYSWSLSSRPFVAFLYLARVMATRLNTLAVADLAMFTFLCALAYLPEAKPRAVAALLSLGLGGAILVRIHLWAPGKPAQIQSYATSMSAATPIIFAGLRLWRPWLWRFPEAAQRERWTVCAVSFAFLLATIWLSVPASAMFGLNFGPRLLLPAYPGILLAVLAVAPQWLQRIQDVRHRRLASCLFCTLLVIGVCDNLVFLKRLAWKKNFSHRAFQVMHELVPGAPILTDQGGWASDPPELLIERPILPLKKAETSEALRAKLVTLAKRFNPSEALVLTNSATPPRWLKEVGELAPISLHDKIKFLGGSFVFHAFRLAYHDAVTSPSQ